MSLGSSSNGQRKNRKAAALEEALRASENAMAEEQAIEAAARHASTTAKTLLNNYMLLRNGEPIKPNNMDELLRPLTLTSPEPLPPHRRGISLVVLLIMISNLKNYLKEA